MALCTPVASCSFAQWTKTFVFLDLFTSPCLVLLNGADLSADIEHEYILNFLKASEGFRLYEMTNRPREVCTRSVTKVEVAGHTQLRANMAYLNSSSHTTWSEKEQMIRDFRRSGRRFIKSYTDKVLNNITFCKDVPLPCQTEWVLRGDEAVFVIFHHFVWDKVYLVF